MRRETGATMGAGRSAAAMVRETPAGAVCETVWLRGVVNAIMAGAKGGACHSGSPVGQTDNLNLTSLPIWQGRPAFFQCLLENHPIESLCQCLLENHPEACPMINNHGQIS